MLLYVAAVGALAMATQALLSEKTVIPQVVRPPRHTYYPARVVLGRDMAPEFDSFAMEDGSFLGIPRTFWKMPNDVQVRLFGNRDILPITRIPFGRPKQPYTGPLPLQSRHTQRVWVNAGLGGLRPREGNLMVR